MKEQPSLPFLGDPVIRPNVSVPQAARPRVERQALQILDRLRRGRLSVVELRMMACQYNARIFELRKAGYVIYNHVNHTTGESWYELKAEP
jgi:hypothetical protein